MTEIGDLLVFSLPRVFCRGFENLVFDLGSAYSGGKLDCFGGLTFWYFGWFVVILTFRCLDHGAWVGARRSFFGICRFADCMVWGGFLGLLICILVLFLVAQPWNLSFGFFRF